MTLAYLTGTPLLCLFGDERTSQTSQRTISGDSTTTARPTQRERPALSVWVGVVVAVLVCSGVFVGGVSAQPACSSIEYSETDGGEFEIATLDQLQCIGQAESPATLSDDYILVSDIDATPTADWDGNFEPIGFEGDGNRWIGPEAGDAFTGTFEGNHKTINGLVINQTREGPLERIEARTTGMIAVNNGTIRNITLEDATVESNYFVGALVGFNDHLGDVIDSTVTGTVEGHQRVGLAIGRDIGYIENVSADGTVRGDIVVGGVTGATGGLVVDSSSAATVYGEEIVGSFIGGNAGQIVNSTARGHAHGDRMVGAFIGYQTNSSAGPRPYEMRRVVATGSATGGSEVGGLVGHLRGDTQVLDGYSTASITGEDIVGGLIGQNTGTMRGGYAAGSVEGESRVDGLVGRNTGTIDRLYADVSATGYDTTVGTGFGTKEGGSAASEMTGESAREHMNLDFGGPWETGAEGSYPVLSQSETPIYRCGSIEEPGIYELVVDLYGYDGGTCLSIDQSDVTIQGSGSTIPNITFNFGSKESVPGVTIGSETALENIAISNLTVDGWACGIQLDNVHGSTIQNVDLHAGVDGICLNESDQNTVSNVTIADPSGTGIILGGSTDNRIERSQVQGVESWAYLALPGDEPGADNGNTITELALDDVELSFDGRHVGVGPAAGSTAEGRLAFSASATHTDATLRNLRLRSERPIQGEGLWQLAPTVSFVGPLTGKDGEMSIRDPIHELPMLPTVGQFVALVNETNTTVEIRDVDETLTAGEAFELTYYVTNHGTSPSLITATVAIDDTILGESHHELGAGEDTVQTVQGVVPDREGTTTLSVTTGVASATTTVTIEAAPNDTNGENGDDPTNDTNGTPGDGDDDNGVDDDDGFGTGFSTLVAVVALGIVVVAIRGTRRL